MMKALGSTRLQPVSPYFFQSSTSMTSEIMRNKYNNGRVQEREKHSRELRLMP
jgi:hypothetical protein